MPVRCSREDAARPGPAERLRHGLRAADVGGQIRGRDFGQAAERRAGHLGEDAEDSRPRGRVRGVERLLSSSRVVFFCQNLPVYGGLAERAPCKDKSPKGRERATRARGREALEAYRRVFYDALYNASSMGCGPTGPRGGSWAGTTSRGAADRACPFRPPAG